MITAKEAIEKLKSGNRLYTSVEEFRSDVSAQTLEHFAKNGHKPYDEKKKPLPELKVKKDQKLEKLSEAPDEAIAMALRKMMIERGGKK